MNFDDIPIGGVFKIRVPAVSSDDMTGGIICLKLRDNGVLKLYDIDGYPYFGVISSSMARYPIIEFYGILNQEKIGAIS